MPAFANVTVLGAGPPSEAPLASGVAAPIREAPLTSRAFLGPCEHLEHLEHWSTGALEHWSTGALEHWSTGSLRPRGHARGRRRCISMSIMSNDEETETNGRGVGSVARGVLDKALGLQQSIVDANIARARQRKPDATPTEVCVTLERIYRSSLAGTGAAVGAAAAVPGVGTGAAVALAGGEVLSSLELTALFALSLAHVHGIRIDELERRRTLIIGLLLGGGGAETVGKMSERTGRHWAKHLVNNIPAGKLVQINKVLGKNFVTKYGTKQGIVVLGKVVPFGIGALIGGGANLALAEGTIRAGRIAFGPAPDVWPDEADQATG
jgi:hypothetical protein